MDKNDGTVVLVTGFGPFDCHQVNASWEAVKELKKLCCDFEKQRGFQLIIQEIPVEYDYVSKEIPNLWEKLKPKLVIHVGVSKYAKYLAIESKARSIGYTRPDVSGNCPNEIECGPPILQTEIDLDSLCSNVNRNYENHGCKACVSADAGLFLCEYIFSKSLSIAPGRTLFIHVPDFDTYPTKQTAAGLYNILCRAIEMIENTV